MSRRLALFFAVIAWFAVVTQAILMVQNRTASVPETIARFFSFFTILTNTLVALFYTTRAAGTSSYNRAGILTALAVYITIVGLVYQVVLRGIWQPTGMQRLVDELLHTVNPVLFILYWYLYEKKSEVQYRQIRGWLVYPLLYLVLILFRGHISGFYPYPFVNVAEIGFGKTMINSLLLMLFFILIASGFIAIGKRLPAVIEKHK
ncbi:MAG TPA: Pr6Pr family membrane protein [Flavisolibacter sp.]|nr:Pr6Pr family membrane protein [Flavisolibacter sp.]